MINSAKETQMNGVECPPLEYPNQSLDNNVITQESDDKIPPQFSSERRVLNESGGTTLDRNNDSDLLSQVLGTPADISLSQHSTPVGSPKESNINAWLKHGD